MHAPLTLIALAAYSVAALRILTWRRDGARHRHHVSWFAWALLVALGGSAIELVIHAKAVGLYAAAATALMRWEPRLKLSRVQLSMDVTETGAGVQVLDIEGSTTVSGDLVSTSVRITNGGAA